MNMNALIVSIGGFISVACLVCVGWLSVSRANDPLRRRLLKETSGVEQKLSFAKQMEKGVQSSFNVIKRMLFFDQGIRTPGFRTAQQKFVFIVLIATVSFALFTFFVKALPKVPGLGQQATLFGVIAAWIGAWLTVRYWTRYHAAKRLDQINQGLIDVLDLWVLCLGAGMSFQAALVRVSQDAELVSPALREEFSLTNHEILAGASRDQALRNLVKRCGSPPDLQGLVSHIIQAERLGSSLANTLKIYAASLRFNRAQDTKELMQKLPVKLAFPLIFCILPALFVVMLGPAVIRMFEVIRSR